MKIVLGIYNTQEWENLTLLNPDWLIYPFVKNVDFTYSVMDIVQDAIIKAEQINFVLDGIIIPLDVIHSYSCNELSVILDTPEYLLKTTFWLKEEVLQKRDLIRKINTIIKNDKERERL